MQRRGRKRKIPREHIKFVFIYKYQTQYKVSPKLKSRYLIGILTDSNKCFFEEFNDNIIKNKWRYSIYKVNKFMDIFLKYDITSSTDVVFVADKFYPNDYFFLLLKLFQAGAKFSIVKTTLNKIVLSIDRTHSLFKGLTSSKLPDGKLIRVASYMNRIYEFMLKNELCPWINNISNQEQEFFSNAKQRMYKYVSVGLYYMCIKRYHYNALMKTKKRKLEIKNNE